MPAKTTVTLIREARALLNLHTDDPLARFLGVSRRTVQRHAHNGGIPGGDGHTKLIRALHPRNPDLALTLARLFNVDLSDLVALAKSSVNPGAVTADSVTPGPAAAGREHVALMVLAACDALNMPPREVRPVLAAIFGQARALGVDMEQLTKLLAEGAGQATP